MLEGSLEIILWALVVFKWWWKNKLAQLTLVKWCFLPLSLEAVLTSISLLKRVLMVIWEKAWLNEEVKPKDMHSIRTGWGSNGSIRCIHSDIHVTSDNFNFIIILVINNCLRFDCLASTLGLDAYMHKEKLKIRFEMNTWTFGLTSARAVVMSAVPRFWASVVSWISWTFLQKSLTSLKLVGSVMPVALLRELYSWWTVNTGSVILLSLKMAGSPQLTSKFYIGFCVGQG